MKKISYIFCMLFLVGLMTACGKKDKQNVISEALNIDVEKGKIFDKFNSGEHKIADNRRSLGLGLYLCKAIVEAHGGSIHVTDNLPHGSVFRFTLPLEEVIIHEEISNPRCGG